MFTQSPPKLGNQFEDDWLLRGWLGRQLPTERLSAHAGALSSMGELAGGELYALQLADRLNEPRLTQWDAWGNRIDQIEVTPMWRRAEPLAAQYGLVALGYDADLGPHARTLQMALAYLFIPSTDFYGCPLAMTDGAARVLGDAGNEVISARALPRLTSRDPETFWTSGQWMTETPGGSDVSNTETVARRDETGQWRLYGRKWFTSAITSQMALTLARPQGDQSDRNPPGSAGLALFYVETRDGDGRLKNIEVLRLKDKLGTRKLPTAELMLSGTPAEPVAGLERGVAHIAPMLNITRTWNSVTACALMRRGIALASDYGRRRHAFGKPVIEHPLHRRTIAELQARWAACTALTFEQIGLLGRIEHGDENTDPDPRSESGTSLLRLLTPIVKLATAKHCIAVASEVLECFGGAGYVEDTGLPALLRDAQVLSIWEGTTNVLALDLLRVLEKSGLEPWRRAVEEKLHRVRDHRLESAVVACRRVLDSLAADSYGESEARGLAMTLADTLALATLAEHGQWCDRHAGDIRPLAAARLFAAWGVDHRRRFEMADADMLAPGNSLTRRREGFLRKAPKFPG